MSKSIFEINLCNPIIDNSNLNNSLSPESKALIDQNSEVFENQEDIESEVQKTGITIFDKS